MLTTPTGECRPQGPGPKLAAALAMVAAVAVAAVMAVVVAVAAVFWAQVSFECMGRGPTAGLSRCYEAGHAPDQGR